MNGLRLTTHAGRFIWRFLSSALFFAAVVLILAVAGGYMYNPSARSFQATGVIAVGISQPPVTISRNGVTIPVVSRSVKFTRLVPKIYTIIVSKPGFTSWKATDSLRAGQAISHPFVTLFLTHPDITAATPGEARDFAAQPPAAVDSDLDVRGRELWVKQVVSTYPLVSVSDDYTLVGRYSSSIGAARWYGGKTHILAQIGAAIHLMDRDGSNDVVLVKLGGSDPAPFGVTRGGKVLLYRQGETIYRRPLL